MKVFIVCQGQGDGARIDGVYSTQALAEKRVLEVDDGHSAILGYWVEEFEVLTANV